MRYAIKDEYYEKLLTCFNNPTDRRYKMVPGKGYKYLHTTRDGGLVLLNPPGARVYFWEDDVLLVTKKEFPEYYL